MVYTPEHGWLWVKCWDLKDDSKLHMDTGDGADWIFLNFSTS